MRIAPISASASANSSIRFPGRITLYTQTLGEGYSAPGLTTLTDTQHHGGTLRMQVTDDVQLRAKADKKVQEQGYTVNAQELNVGYQLTDRWNVSTGVRKDEREYDGRDRAAELATGRAHGWRRAGRLRFALDVAHVWLRAGHDVEVGGARRQRSRRSRRRVSIHRSLPRRCRSLRRRSRTRRQGRHELPVLRAHELVSELRARERAHRQRLARTAAAI